MKKIILISTILLLSFQIVFGQNKTITNIGIVNKKAQGIPKPKVPKKHLKNIEEQIVAVQIIVDMNGKVSDARAITGHLTLRLACEKAARQTKFHPILATIPPIKIRALLVYKFKTDGTIVTDVESDDSSVAATPINLVSPVSPSCNCNFGKSPKIIVIADINEQGKVIEAKGVSGHPLLRLESEKAALKSTFLPVNIKSKLIITYAFEAIDKWSVKFLSADIKNGKDIRINK